MKIEQSIQKRLNKILNGQLEVYTEVGKIDILTPTEIIEIKEIKNWKEGVGQLMSYKSCPTFVSSNHKKLLVVFGFKEDIENYLSDILFVTNQQYIEVYVIEIGLKLYKMYQEAICL